MLDLVDELIEDGNKIRHRLECSNFQLMNRTFSLCLDKTIPIMSQLEEAFVRSESTGEFKLIVSSNKNEHFEKYLNSFGRKYGSRIQRQSQEINQKSIAIDLGINAIYYFDHGAKIAGVWLASRSEYYLPTFITPFRTVINRLMKEESGVIIHASAIDTAGKGLLIAGASGSGKSTLSLYAAANGKGILGDDAIAYSNGNLYSIYRFAKAKPGLLNLDSGKFATRQYSNVLPEDQKTSIDLMASRISFIRKSPLRAIIFPRVGDEPSINSIGRSQALKIMAPNTMSELLGGTKCSFDVIAELCRNYPSFELTLGGNLDENNEFLLKLAEKV